MLNGPMRTVGIIGQGFVGTAVREGLCHAFDVVTYDKKDGQRVVTYGRESTTVSLCGLPLDPIFLVLGKSDDIIFLCLPTPMLPDGSCDISIVRAVVQQIQMAACLLNSRPSIVIKSTIPPGTTDRLTEENPGLDICFQPEFLTEANAAFDFRNQTRIICGGKPEAVDRVRQLYSIAYPTVPFIGLTAVEAELVKYFTNCALACRVSLANEFNQIAQALGVDYETVIGAVCLDSRMGSHWKVPGHLGQCGFGGSCFPKDLNALISAARALGVAPTVMEASWAKNLEVRPERDWERLVGRAVTGEM
jgi:UDPglucose 6-dehydrogenase